MTAPTTTRTAPLPHVCDTASCRAATTHRETCECSCGGDGHGADHAALFQAARDAVTARATRLSDVFLGAAAADDEPW